MLKISIKIFFIKKLLLFYKKYTKQIYIHLFTSLYKTSLSVSIPNRQIYTTYTRVNNTRITSTGYVVAASGINLKYYKRCSRSNTGHILFLQKLYQNYLKYLYLYRVININCKQWLFFQKYLILINPNIFITQHKKSYNTYFRPIKRLKKRIVKVILKQ